MNKFAVGLAVIVIGAAVGWYIMQGKMQIPAVKKQPAITQITPSATASGGVQDESANETPQDQTAVSQVTVTYTDSGFSPKVIRVKVGTAVTFVNRSASGMWIISDLHPTHRILSDLNEKASVQSGGSYTYTFARVGTWPYHNEMNLSVKGTVIAE